MHAIGYAHRDLKVENILVSVDEAGQPIFKLGDFGSCSSEHIEAPSALDKN